MRRSSLLLFALMLAAAWTALATTLASGAVSPSPTPDTGLAVPNPANLTILPPMVPGQPIYPRVNGRVYFGVNDNSLWRFNPTTSQRADLATSSEVGQIAAGVGASMVRLDMSWPSVQPLANDWHWDSTDDMYRGLISQGIRPLWMINSTPRFAVAAGDVGTCTGDGWGVTNNYCEAEPDAAHPENLRTFGAEFARRYPLSAGFEYRNEPNLSPAPNFFCDGNYRRDPVKLATSLKDFVIGVHSVHPELRVLGGALAGCDGNSALTSYAATLLDTLGSLPAEAGQSPPFISALSIHPYDLSTDQHLFPQILQEVETTLATHGQPGLRVVISELGASSNQVSNQANRSLRMQSYFTKVNDLRDQNRYDAFVAFNTIETGNGYGWLKPKDALGKFQALRPYCDFRTLLQVNSPLPSVVRTCLPGF